jgi:hypothetical protein
VSFADTQSPCWPGAGQQHASQVPASSPGAMAPAAAVDTNTATACPTTQQLLVTSGAGAADPFSDPGAWAARGSGAGFPSSF